MKFSWGCIECQQEFHERGLSLHEINELIWKGEYGSGHFNKKQDFNDENYYEVECNNGHKYNLTLQNELYEIHFDFGVVYYTKDMNRAAFLEFIAAYEKFIEYANIFMLYDGNSDGYADVWKLVKNQSERQFGAYIFLYYKLFKKIPDIKNDMTKLRNDVVHRGHFPTREETREYGEYVLHFISEAKTELQKISKDEMSTPLLMEKKWTAIFKFGEESQRLGCNHNMTLSIQTVLSRLPREQITTLEESSPIIEELLKSGVWHV